MLFASLFVLLTVFLVLAVASEDSVFKNLRLTTVRLDNGSASIIEAPSGKKYMLTCWHVCNSGNWLNVITGHYDEGPIVKGLISKKDPLKDLCAIRVDERLQSLKIGKSLSVKERVYTRGYPLGIVSENSGIYIKNNSWNYSYPIEEVGECFKGSIKEWDAQGRTRSCNVTYNDAVTTLYGRPGSSGSPVVNIKSELVGVISSWYGRNDTTGMVKLSDIQEFMKGL